jgi:hypothetical protein
LLVGLKQAIDDKLLVTWSYDRDDDFTYCMGWWRNAAWLRPKLLKDRLIFTTLKPRSASVPLETYGVYHGHFIEAMLIHCSELFTNCSATATPGADDFT